MRYLLLALTLSVVARKSFGQYEWFNEYAGSGYVTISKLTSDQNGNLFSVGNFENTVTLGTTTYFGGGAFLIKLTSAGEFVWANRFSYETLDFFALVQVETDLAGNIYTTGQYPKSASVGGVSISGGVLNSFLAKFDTDGKLVWIKTFIGLQEIFDISVNKVGDIGITGILYAPFLNIDAVSLIPSKPRASFGAYFNTDGVVQWAQIFSEIDEILDFPVAIRLDNNGNFYLSQRFSGPITIGNTQLNSTGSWSLFMIKIDRLGQLDWHKEIKRQSPYTNSTELGELTTDENGDLYACGSFWINFQIDDINISSTANSVFTGNRFICKFSHVNGQIEWAKHSIGQLEGYTAENIIAKGDTVYVSGLVEGNPYFEALHAENGNTVNEPLLFPFRGDIANGLQVDADGMIFMSGRRRNPEMTGYIFKYNPVGEITTEPALCFNQVFRATVTPIAGASTYEWEVTYNTTTNWYETLEPTLEIASSELIGVTDLRVRVRGINNTNKTPFTGAKSVTIILLPEAPIIKSNCYGVELVRGNTIEWHTESGKLDYPLNTTAIPGQIGQRYFAIETNVCGNQPSNLIEFKQAIIPNVITPDGDGKNETLILDERLSNATVVVYDRWGKQVFESLQYLNNWTGTGLSSGVYFVSIQHPCFKDIYKSALSIIR